jgi:hypothetical protein
VVRLFLVLVAVVQGGYLELRVLDQQAVKVVELTVTPLAVEVLMPPPLYVLVPQQQVERDHKMQAL